MKRPNLYDRLKIIAILTMIVDHIGYAFFSEISWLRVVGRIAFPIFLFLVGFNGNYKWRRDLLRFAIAVQIPIFVLAYRFGFGNFALNILWGILIGRVVLGLVDGLRNKSLPQRVPFPFSRDTNLLLIVGTIVLLILHPWLSNVWEYGSFVILFPLGGWMMRILARVQQTHHHSVVPLPSQGGLLIMLYLLMCFSWLGFWTWYVFGFNQLQLIVVGVFFALLLCIFFVLGQGNYFLPVGKYFDRGLLFFSKNALMIYVFHLLLFGGIKIFLLYG